MGRIGAMRRQFTGRGLGPERKKMDKGWGRGDVADGSNRRVERGRARFGKSGFQGSKSIGRSTARARGASRGFTPAPRSDARPIGPSLSHLKKRGEPQNPETLKKKPPERRGEGGRRARATAWTRQTTTRPIPHAASKRVTRSSGASRRACSPPPRRSGRGNQRFRTLTLAAQRNGAIHGPDQGHGLGGRLGGDANVAADADGGHRRGEGGHDEGHLATLCRRALLRMSGRGDLRFGFNWGVT